MGLVGVFSCSVLTDYEVGSRVAVLLFDLELTRSLTYSVAAEQAA